MQPIDYNGRIATVYDRGRALPLDALAAWRTVLARYLPSGTGRQVLDLGSGTGVFSYALAEWFEIEVIGVEPAQAMRQEAMRLRPHPRMRYMAGDAARIPLDAGSCDCAWLSTVIHHIPDLRVCARELRRVLRPGGPILIRSAFPGRLDGINLFRFFPGARMVAERFPSVEATVAAFASAGFTQEHIERVPQVTAASLSAVRERVRLRADTTLESLSDEEFAQGLAALERAAAGEAPSAPVVDWLDLLVLR